MDLLMSHLLEHRQCPECAKLGKDTTKDNLAIYSDGGEHCYGCGYHVFPDKLQVYKSKQIEVVEHKVVLPTDVEQSYPDRVLQWMNNYELTRNTLIVHKAYWSENKQYLIFPYYVMKQLISWQGRYFGPNKDHPKWITYGKPPEYYLGQETDVCIFVEDIVSAIKLSRYQQTSPLFGSYVSYQRLLSTNRRCSHVVFWLDPDKRKEALLFAKQASLMYNRSSVIFSDKDPKEHTYEELEAILDSKSIPRYH